MAMLIHRRYDVFEKSLTPVDDGVSLAVSCAFLVDGSIGAMERVVRVSVKGTVVDQGRAYEEYWNFPVSDGDFKHITDAFQGIELETRRWMPRHGPIPNEAYFEVGRWLRIGAQRNNGGSPDHYYLRFYESQRSITAVFDRFLEFRKFPALIAQGLTAHGIY